MIDHNTLDYTYAGFFATAGVSAMHFQDIVIAITLGFFGGLGGFLFKLLREKLSKK